MDTRKGLVKVVLRGIEMALVKCTVISVCKKVWNSWQRKNRTHIYQLFLNLYKRIIT